MDREDHCIEGLIGTHECETSSGIRYTLVTDQREITLDTAKRAQIYDV
jgi:hypothetical protein